MKKRSLITRRDFLRTTALIPALPFLHTNQTLLAAPAEEVIAENGSYATTCAEEDNVNVRLRAEDVKRFQVIAQHPRYEIGDVNTPIDLSGCAHVFPESGSVEESAKAQLVEPRKILWDDGVNVIEVRTEPNWWRPFRMHVQVNNNAALGHWIILATRMKGQSRPAEFFVLYEDGYMRLTPYPPVGIPYFWFGSSVIIGPAAPAKRPYVDIQEIKINLATRCIDIFYRAGRTAHLCLSVNRAQAVADVQIAYDTSHPFATLRSMWVEDGNSDVARIRAQEGDFPILSGWTALKGPWWFFHRKIRSRHNTPAPDIRIEVMP